MTPRLRRPSSQSVRFIVRLSFCLAIGSVFATGGRAQNVNLTVNAAQIVRTVDSRAFGVNAVMWDPDEADSQTVALVQATGLSVIRIPGGSVSDTYDWSTNRGYSITTSGSRSTRGPLNNWSWATGVDQFTKLVASLNSTSFVTVNFGSGTPQQAAAWVAYANGRAALLGTASDVTLGVDAYGVDWKTAGYWSGLRASAPLPTDDGRNFLRLSRSAPFALRYWEIGNEIYGTWETDCSAVPNDAYTYATAVGAANTGFWALMKMVDPTIRIGVVISTGEDSYANSNGTSHAHAAVNPRTGATHYGWGPVLLGRLKTLGITPDFLTYHRYEQNPGQENDARLLAAPESGIPGSTSSWASDAQSLRQELSDYLGSNGAAVELLVGENNTVNENPGKQADSLVNALYYADTIGNILQTEFNSHVWWALRNGPATTTNSAGATVLSGNMSSSLYGWRINGDYGILGTPSPAVTSPSGTSYDPFPVYYMMKLIAHFASGGDTVVKATSDNALLTAYAVLKAADGSLRILVINKSPSSTLTATISLAGFVPQAAVATYSYGIPQDNSTQTGTGSPDIATSSLGGGNTNFTASFGPYSATVLALQPAAPVAPTIATQPASLAVNAGASPTLGVVAYGATGYQWQLNGANIAGATNSALTLSNVGTTQRGSYTAIVSNPFGSVTSAAATVAVSVNSFLYNISTLGYVGSGANQDLDAGFYTNGSGSKNIVVRGIGPNLAALDPKDYSGLILGNPQLILNSATSPLSTTTAWGGSQPLINAFATVYAASFPSNSSDAAVFTSVPAGPGVGYTADVKSANGGTGVAQIEVYDYDSYVGTPASRLINISTRGYVGTGLGTGASQFQFLDAGFWTIGSTSETLLIRAVGPAEAANLPTQYLAKPLLTLYDSSGKVITTNAGWGYAPVPGNSTVAAGILPATTAIMNSVYASTIAAGSADCAIVVTLPANAGYTATVTSADYTSTGIALVEVYDIP